MMKYTIINKKGKINAKKDIEFSVVQKTKLNRLF